MTHGDLYTEGYRVQAGAKAHTFEVVKPCGTVYVANPVAGCCSCPARGVCCHLRQLAELVTRCWCEVEGFLSDWEAYDLRAAWEVCVQAGLAPLAAQSADRASRPTQSAARVSKIAVKPIKAVRLVQAAPLAAVAVAAQGQAQHVQTAGGNAAGW